MHLLAILLLAISQLPPTETFAGRVDAQEGGYVLAVKMNVQGDTFDHWLVPRDAIQRARLAKVASRRGEITVVGWRWDTDDGKIAIDIKTFKEIDP